jgi:glycosyltransferase involved in cell wall biosynthesis
MKISICLVTCNGGKFVERQLKSILSQTLLPDEIIVVDDCSEDNTVYVIKKILVNSKIKYIFKQNDLKLGINKSFESCLSTASCDIIVLSDQDDFWFKNRLLTIRNHFLQKLSTELILTNAHIERNGIVTKDSISKFYPYSKSIFLNFIKNRFTGCQIAIKRSLLERLYPFPNDYVCYYDHWISLFSLLRRTTTYIKVEQGYYCRHLRTVTDFSSSRSLNKIIISRIFLLFIVLKKYIFNKIFKK